MEKIIWKVNVSSLMGPLVAASPIPQPSPNIVARVRAMTTFFSDRINLVSFLVIGTLRVLADGGHDENKHDPVDNVHENKWHNCPSVKGPLFCSAAD